MNLIYIMYMNFYICWLFSIFRYLDIDKEDNLIETELNVYKESRSSENWWKLASLTRSRKMNIFVKHLLY